MFVTVQPSYHWAYDGGRRFMLIPSPSVVEEIHDYCMAKELVEGGKKMRPIVEVRTSSIYCPTSFNFALGIPPEKILRVLSPRVGYHGRRDHPSSGFTR
jgi:hypothetical protein